MSDDKIPPPRGPGLWRTLSLYEQFEQLVIILLTGVIAVVAIAAVWALALKVFHALILSGTFDPADATVFQELFGAIFTVIIALELKRSLLVAAERRSGVVQVRVVILIAVLAIVRKFIILDLAHTEAFKILALAAAILALGVVYWLVREQDRRDQVQEIHTD